MPRIIEHSLSSIVPCGVCGDTGCHLATRISPPMFIERTPVSLEIGESYSYHPCGVGSPRESAWKYSPVGIARHVHSGQYLVVYKGLEGDDTDKLYVAPLVDWHSKFKLERKAAAAAPPEPESVPEKVVDYTTTDHGK